MQREDRQRSRWSWARQLRWVGLAGFLSMGLVGVALVDLEAMAVALGFGVSLFLLRRGRGRAGAVGLALVSAVTLFFLLPAALTNLTSAAGLVAVAVPALLSTVALVTLGSALAWRTGRASEGSAGTRVLLVVAAALGAGLVGASVLAGGELPEAAPADIRLVSENVAFSESELTAPAGTVTVELSNKDLFWHTFTIDELGVDLLVPVQGRRSASFAAAPGTYRFVCRVPGHVGAGMEGTLTVEG
jgi:plastocyanin